MLNNILKYVFVFFFLTISSNTSLSINSTKTEVKNVTDTPVPPKPDDQKFRNYNYEYFVNDTTVGDIKEHRETSKDDVVKGHYSLIEPDGRRRTVKYRVSKNGGFRVRIERERKIKKSHTNLNNNTTEVVPKLEKNDTSTPKLLTSETRAHNIQKTGKDTTESAFESNRNKKVAEMTSLRPPKRDKKPISTRKSQNIQKLDNDIPEFGSKTKKNRTVWEILLLRPPKLERNSVSIKNIQKMHKNITMPAPEVKSSRLRTSRVLASKTVLQNVQKLNEITKETISDIKNNTAVTDMLSLKPPKLEDDEKFASKSQSEPKQNYEIEASYSPVTRTRVSFDDPKYSYEYQN